MKRTNLVDFIKGKVEKGSFPYQEGAWEQAADQFAAWDAARKRKRRLLFLILPILAGCSMLTWQLWAGADAGQNELAQTTYAQTSIVPNTISYTYSSKSNEHTSIVRLDSISNATAAISNSAHAISNFTAPILNTHSRKSPLNTFTTSLPSRENNPSPQIGERLQEQTTSTTVLNKKKLPISIEEISFKGELTQAESSIFPQLYANGKMPFKRLSPYVEVGYSFFKGFTNETITNPEWAGSPLIGAGVLYRLNRRLRLKAGFQYTNRTNLNHGLKRQELTFDFVQQNRESWWTPEKLHYVSLPLEIQFRTFAKQRFLLGGQLGYLMGTEGSLLTQNTNFYQPVGEPESVNAPSYVTGVSVWDLSIHTGYELRLSPRWGAAATYHYGLKDVMKDDIFNISGMNRNSRFSVNMTYNF